MVTVLPFYSDYGGLNPAEVYSFLFLTNDLKDGKEAGDGPIKKDK